MKKNSEKMDKDAAASAIQKDQKDGFSQLAEKMEQVRTQMINMERKYDELYRTVKDKEFRSSSNLNKESQEEVRSGTESIDVSITARSSTTAETEKSPTKSPEKSAEDTASTKSNLDAEIEKMEDNPFM